jgi:hypothetical protein
MISTSPEPSSSCRIHVPRVDVSTGLLACAVSAAKSTAICQLIHHQGEGFYEKRVRGRGGYACRSLVNHHQTFLLLFRLELMADCRAGRTVLPTQIVECQCKVRFINHTKATALAGFHVACWFGAGGVHSPCSLPLFSLYSWPSAGSTSCPEQWIKGSWPRQSSPSSLSRQQHQHQQPTYTFRSSPAPHADLYAH